MLTVNFSDPGPMPTIITYVPVAVPRADALCGCEMYGPEQRH
jgi:hypothetical protein